jgi:hypothetical protein
MIPPNTMLQSHGLRAVSSGDVIVTPTGGERQRLADALASGGGGGGVVLSTGRIALSNAQLLNLFSAPVTIVAAPGAGKGIIVVAGIINFTFGTTAYVSNYNLEGLYYGPTREQSMNTIASILTGSADGFTALVPAGAFGLPSAIDNVPILLYGPDPTGGGGPSANMSGGDGTGSITAFYVIVDL